MAKINCVEARMKLYLPEVDLIENAQKVITLCKNLLISVSILSMHCEMVFAMHTTCHVISYVEGFEVSHTHSRRTGKICSV